MTEEERLEFWEDEDYKEPEEMDAEEEVEEEEPVFTFKCKPCYNYQSIEFEFVGGWVDIPEMMELYRLLYNGLKAIMTDEEEKKLPPKEPATEKQINLLKKLGVKFDKNIGKTEARDLIKKVMDS